VPPEVLETIASNTDETRLYTLKESNNTHPTSETWKDLTGDDVGAFIGAVMLMGVHPQSYLEDYWNCSEDKPTFPLQKYITRQRFKQICRYLKVN
jgi:Transposase IS4